MGRNLSAPRLQVIAAGLSLTGLALFPWLGEPVYFVSFAFTVFLYVTLAGSWNLIGGYAGYLSFGHVAFFGIGAYANALMASAFSLSAPCMILAAVPAGAVAAAVSLLIGYPCLRLRGPYFAVITLCFTFVARLAVNNLSIFGGSDGLWLKAMTLPIETSRSVFYELMFVLMIVTTAVSAWIGRSRLGAGLRAIKEDEEVAQTMAINAPRLKITAFAFSAFFTGMAGGLYANYLTYIHPDIVFDVNISILIVLMALFGGTSWWLGPVVGAASLSIINELLSTFVKAELARLIYGCLFIVVIIFMPNGVTEFLAKLRRAPGLPDG